VAPCLASGYFFHAIAHFPRHPVVRSVSPGVALHVRADFAPSPWPLSLHLDPQSTQAPTFPPSPWPPTPPPDIESAYMFCRLELVAFHVAPGDSLHASANDPHQCMVRFFGCWRFSPLHILIPV
jgi:hypothetical protein